MCARTWLIPIESETTSLIIVSYCILPIRLGSQQLTNWDNEFIQNVMSVCYLIMKERFNFFPQDVITYDLRSVTLISTADPAV